MPTFLTEYIDTKGQRWGGVDIEADSWEEAERLVEGAIAAEKMFNGGTIEANSLVVVGTLESEIDFAESQSHSVTPITCSSCSYFWVAVYPSGVKFLDCPNCSAKNKA